MLGLVAATAFECAPGRVGGVHGDRAEPGLERGGVSDLVDTAHELHGDILQKVFEVGLSGLVGHENGGDPAAVVFPDLALGVALAPDRGENERSTRAASGSRSVFEPDKSHVLVLPQ